MLKKIRKKISSHFLKKLALYLEQPSKVQYHPVSVPNPEALRNILQPCDILLVEGNLKYSEVIKYVTQSTWSHCALYIGTQHSHNNNPQDPPCLIEALLSEGVVVSPLSDYFNLNTRILRPVSLTQADKQKIIDFSLNKIGNAYDVDNVFDLLKYYVPTTRVFIRGKGDAGNIFGSGDPEQVICSSLIAQAFQSVHYPILPDVEKIKDNVSVKKAYNQTNPVVEILRKRHFSLYSPRDFDMSPFFKIVKPTIENGFNHRDINWHDPSI